MKIRTGFVSNSSSSSFLIIGKDINIPKIDSEKLCIPKTFGGCYEFGWGPEEFSDVGSRINFAMIQALNMDDREKDMLDKVLKESFNIDKIENKLHDDWNFDKKYCAYIDHQSCASEGMNTKIFESEDTLIKFLFSDDSIIHVDNDNH